jgi:uncharacterized membrane protein YccC
VSVSAHSPTSRPYLRVLRGLFEFRPAPPHRWMFALRAAICMGVPILTGWLMGNTPAGLMASIGGFTSLYGSGRPYLSRARHLGAIALAFALAVTLGLSVAPSPWLVVIAVASIAMIATWLSNALQIGPPGAYLFTLACAAGTAMPNPPPPMEAGMLVLGGGMFAWLVQMGGALFNPRGPERNAVSAAANAVRAYIDALGKPHAGAMRQRAAHALHNAWSVLVTQQPVAPRAGGELSRLRALNRELHLVFATALGAATRDERPPPGLAAEARALAARVRDREARIADTDSVPLGHPRASEALMESLRPGSNSFRVIVRVGIAAFTVGILGAALHFERAYWAVAATVLMLHQGFDWLRMLQRSIERLIGTWIGLALAGAILWWYPQGIWLALTIMALQFTIEMLVLRNYALAAVFITGAALTIASGGQRIDDPAPYLLARGLDTLAGCAMALLVFRLIPPIAPARQIPLQLIRALSAIRAAIPHMAHGTVTNAAARAARRDVHRASFALTAAFEESVTASHAERRSAEVLWPVIAAVERLADRTLSTCWAFERLGEPAAREAAASMFAGDSERNALSAIEGCLAALRNEHAPPPLPDLPQVLAQEIQGLHECLVREAGSAANQG